jgi:Bacterial sugar transferase
MNIMPIHVKSRRITLLINILFDVTLLMGAFAIIYYTKRGHFEVEESFVTYLPLHLISWLFASLLGRKFKGNGVDSITNQLKPYISSILLQIGILSILLYGFKLFALSRFIIFGSVGLFFVFELLLLSGSYAVPFVFGKGKKSSSNFSFLFFIGEFALITATFLGIYFYKRGTIDLTDDYKAVFVIIYFSWIFIGLAVHKFKIQGGKNYLKTIWPFAKSSIIQLSLISFFIFAFQVLEYSRLILFGSILAFSLSEFLIVTIYYLYKKPQESDETQIDFFSVNILREPKIIEPQIESERVLEGKYKIPDAKVESVGFGKKLENVYLKKAPEIYNFVNETVDLSSVDLMTSEIIHSANPYNVEVLPEESLDFFLNLHEVNDVRRINSYFMTVHEKLKWNGVFAGRFETFAKRRKRIFDKYPYYLALVVYFFDFIWKRIFPKLPFFQKIYFAISKGQNRVFSKAEALGRLYFCGFEVVALEEIDNFIYFIVKKANKPSTEASPSYGPLFKMRRSGKNGNSIYVYKFRTMHPYSEFLQGYITRRNGYAENGKIQDDFRATAWGKFMRKYWLDELPQLINLVKGEMSLVGIRPLSDRFLKEYPQDVLELRVKHKPGCVPPYVALKMQDVERYIESEKIYLLDKKRKPLTTDFKYFSLALYNIFTNKIRSA